MINFIKKNFIKVHITSKTKSKLATRLATNPTKPPDPAFVYLTSHYQFQLLNMSPPDSLLIAPHCPSRSYA